jgi:hypothetical protein
MDVQNKIKRGLNLNKLFNEQERKWMRRLQTISTKSLISNWGLNTNDHRMILAIREQ